jgi:hypothetical protein
MVVGDEHRAMPGMAGSSRKVVPLQQADDCKRTRTGQAAAGRRLSSGLISVPLEEQASGREAGGCCGWLRYRLETFRFVLVSLCGIIPGLFLFAWASHNLSGGEGGTTGSWFAFELNECATEKKTQKDARLIFWLAVAGMLFLRCSIAISQSKFLMVKNVWPHEVGAFLFVTLTSWFVAQEMFFKRAPKGGFPLFFITMVFAYNSLSTLTRRAAQYRSSTKNNIKKRFLQKCVHDLTFACACTAMVFMNALYLIASERSSGISDIFINGIGYPALIAGFRTYMLQVNQRVLQEKRNTNKERLVEVTGLQSSIIVSIQYARSFRCLEKLTESEALRFIFG